MTQSIATTVKLRFSNEVHALLEPQMDLTRRERNLYTNRQKRKELTTLTDAQKIELADKIIAMHNAASEEIGYVKFKRREARRTTKARLAKIEEQKAKGTYKPKKRQTKEQYEKSLGILA